MSAEKFLTFAEQIPLPVFGFNPRTYELAYANPAFYSLFNAAPAVSAGWIWTRIPAVDQEYLKKNLSELLNGKAVKDIELRIKLENEDHSWLRVTAMVADHDQEKLVIGYVFDVTAEVNNVATYIKYANKKNSILNILAHDLSGYLGIANAATQLLRKGIHDPAMQNLIDTTSKITGQAVSLIKDLTQREFLETAEVELVKKRIDIAQKLRDYLEESQRSEQLTRRRFRFSSSHHNIFIRLDEAKFIQVINNLISNSLKFTHENGTISLYVEDRDTSVLFTISDDGIGIPREFHSTLFEKFSDAGRKGLHGEPSVGLGMSVVKTIVDWHQGKIWFDSKENAGTTFYVDIPKS